MIGLRSPLRPGHLWMEQDPQHFGPNPEAKVGGSMRLILHGDRVSVSGGSPVQQVGVSVQPGTWHHSYGRGRSSVNMRSGETILAVSMFQHVEVAEMDGTTPAWTVSVRPMGILNLNTNFSPSVSAVNGPSGSTLNNSISYIQKP